MKEEGGGVRGSKVRSQVDNGLFFSSLYPLKYIQYSVTSYVIRTI